MFKCEIFCLCFFQGFSLLFTILFIIVSNVLVKRSSIEVEH